MSHPCRERYMLLLSNLPWGRKRGQNFRMSPPNWPLRISAVRRPGFGFLAFPLISGLYDGTGNYWTSVIMRFPIKKKQNFLVTQYGCREKSNKITKRKFHIPISRVMALSKPLVITAMIITITEVTWFSGLYREEERFLCPCPKSPFHPTANQNYMAE